MWQWHPATEHGAESRPRLRRFYERRSFSCFAQPDTTTVCGITARRFSLTVGRLQKLVQLLKKNELSSLLKSPMIDCNHRQQVYVVNVQDRLRKQLLTTRHRHTRFFSHVLIALQSVDAHAAPLPLEDAFTSRAINRSLWDALPNEHAAYHFDSPESLTAQGRWCIKQHEATSIILHLGWEGIAFSTTVVAAWETWPRFCHLNTDAHNVCIYPESFTWYIIRAGPFLYPNALYTVQRPTFNAGGAIIENR